MLDNCPFVVARCRELALLLADDAPALTLMLRNYAKGIELNFAPELLQPERNGAAHRLVNQHNAIAGLPGNF